MLGRRRRCWSNHSHVLVQHCTSIAQTFRINQTGVCSIYARRRSLLFCKCTKLKRQYVRTCKARTYCHIISARAESCEKRAYPANTIHWTNAGLMLGGCRRRRANGPTLTQHRVNVSCLLGIYCLPPLLTVALSHAMGAGGRCIIGLPKFVLSWISVIFSILSTVESHLLLYQPLICRKFCYFSILKCCF